MTRGGNTRKTGARYELLAAVHLEKCGYHIIENYYMKVHGIRADQSVRFDVVAFDGEEMELIRDAFAYAGNVRF